MTINLSIQNLSVADLWMTLILYVIGTVVCSIFGTKFLWEGINELIYDVRKHWRVSFVEVMDTVVGVLITTGAICCIILGIIVCKPAPAAITTLNNTVSEQYADISDISCPALPDNPQKQNAKLIDNQTRVKCSWKYDGKTVNGSLYFDMDGSDGTVTFINDNNTTWCPVDWRIGNDCMPYQKIGNKVQK